MIHILKNFISVLFETDNLLKEFDFNHYVKKIIFVFAAIDFGKIQNKQFCIISIYYRYGGIDLNARRKNATRETTNTLKAWLYEHRKNPYPTKGEKIMLAIITKMTLTQVSTWFANARRRLKKENKMTWSPRNRSEDDGDDDLDNDDDDDLLRKADNLTDKKESLHKIDDSAKGNYRCCFI